MHPGSSLLLSPLLQKGGMEVGGLGMPLCCFPRVFLSPHSTWSSGRGGGASGRAFGARELACLFGSFVDWGSRSCSLAADSCYLFCPGWFSLLCTLGEVLGRENLRGCFLCSRLPLPPHLCTLGEVVGRVGLPSAAPVRVLPGLLIFGLGSREGTLSPLLVEWLSCAVLLLTLSLRLVQRSGRCGGGSSRLLFSLV